MNRKFNNVYFAISKKYDCLQNIFDNFVFKEVYNHNYFKPKLRGNKPP